MVEQLVGLNVAKLAKKKGFNWSAVNHYGLTRTPEGVLLIEPDSQFGDSNFKGQDWNSEDWAYDKWSAPTQSLLQKWLREEHNIDVYPTCDWADEGRVYISGISYVNDASEVDIWISQAKQDKFFESSIKYKTFEEALEVALHKALTIIK